MLSAAKASRRRSSTLSESGHTSGFARLLSLSGSEKVRCRGRVPVRRLRLLLQCQSHFSFIFTSIITVRSKFIVFQLIIAATAHGQPNYDKFLAKLRTDSLTCPDEQPDAA